MERGFDSKYKNSQDHLIITLNEQIQAMMPLKESYSALQRYHMKLNSDLQAILSEHKQFSVVYGKQIKDLSNANSQCDNKKTKMIQQLRNFQKQAAKLTLQRKNLMAASETLSSKCNLQNQQSLALQNRTRELLQMIKKTEQNIVFNRKLVGQIQTEIKLKQSENSEIKYQINRRNQVNKKLQKGSDEIEQKIKKTGCANQSVATTIRQLQQKINRSQLGIRDELKQSKQLNQKYLKTKEKLSTLDHQKQYYTRLIESQLLCQEDLDISDQKLKTIIERRTYQLAKVKEQNRYMKQKIVSTKQNKQKSEEHKAVLTQHLAELIKTNTVLLQSMERYCSQDRRVHKILNQKFERLEIACNKVRKVGNASCLNFEGERGRNKALQDIMNYQNRKFSDKKLSATNESRYQKSDSNWNNQTQH